MNTTRLADPKIFNDGTLFFLDEIHLCSSTEHHDPSIMEKYDEWKTKKSKSSIIFMESDESYLYPSMLTLQKKNGKPLGMCYADADDASI